MTRRVDPARSAAREAMGLRLRLLRIGAQLSQASVAASLNVRPATLSGWEQGTSELAALDALRLADLYQVEVTVIFGRAAMPQIR